MTDTNESIAERLRSFYSSEPDNDAARHRVMTAISPSSGGRPPSSYRHGRVLAGTAISLLIVGVAMVAAYVATRGGAKGLSVPGSASHVSSPAPAVPGLSDSEVQLGTGVAREIANQFTTGPLVDNWPAAINSVSLLEAGRDDASAYLEPDCQSARVILVRVIGDLNIVTSGLGAIGSVGPTGPSSDSPDSATTVTAVVDLDSKSKCAMWVLPNSERPLDGATVIFGR